MEWLRQLTLFLHLLAAVTWIGGNIFLAAVGPYLRALSPSQGSQLLRAMGLRFRDLSWIAVLVLIGTGVSNLAFLKAFANLSAFLTIHPALSWKLGLVALMIVIKILHDFVVGPRAVVATTANPDHPKKPKIWWTALWLGRLNLLLGLLVLYLAILLRG